MEQIKISAKVLGEIAMDDFCPRCFWIKLHSKKLPWQIFPGIFSSIDAYTKKVAHNWINSKRRPDFFDILGVVGFQKTPHWSKFFRDVPEYGLTISGGCDDIWTLKDGGIHIPDYKTAKYTKNQDKLLPMYQKQLNVYGWIADGQGEDVRGLSLIYMEPITDEKSSLGETLPEIFKMRFQPTYVPIDMDLDGLLETIKTAREIYDGPIPDSTDSCKNCDSLAEIIRMVA